MRYVLALFFAVACVAQPITIAVLNHTTVESFDGKGPLQPIIDAVNLQIERDFAPHWGISARLVIKTHAEDGDWTLELLDYSDVNNSILVYYGYHTVGNDGLPRAMVAVRASMVTTWASRLISHEILEMLANPYADRRIVIDGKSIWQEVCDPTGDTEEYMIGGYLMNDFVYPAFFRPGGIIPFNHRHTMTEALKPTRRGYMFWEPVVTSGKLTMDWGTW